jgi:GxxExxY protein
MPTGNLIEEALSRSVIGAFFEVYNTLGYGFLEHIYVLALERELRARGHDVAREVGVRIFYKGEELAYQRLDMVIDGKIVVETKATTKLHAGATRQVYNYLKATNIEVGLLLHFGREANFHRIVRSNDKKPRSNPQNSPDPLNPRPAV